MSSASTVTTSMTTTTPTTSPTMRRTTTPTTERVGRCAGAGRPCTCLGGLVPRAGPPSPLGGPRMRAATRCGDDLRQLRASDLRPSDVKRRGPARTGLGLRPTQRDVQDAGIRGLKCGDVVSLSRPSPLVITDVRREVLHGYKVAPRAEVLHELDDVQPELSTRPLVMDAVVKIEPVYVRDQSIPGHVAPSDLALHQAHACARFAPLCFRD